MQVPSDSGAAEAAGIRRSMNDAVRLMAAPSHWVDTKPAPILNPLLEALLGVFSASFIFVRMNQRPGCEQTETVQVAKNWSGTRDAREFGKMMECLTVEVSTSTPDRNSLWLNGEQVWVTQLPLGSRGELGNIVAGSTRNGFPAQTERLILEIAASQLTLALEKAGLPQQQAAEPVHTGALLGDGERESLLFVETTPGLVALLTPTGGVDAANTQLLEHLGQSLAELRQGGINGKVHPDDFADVTESIARSMAMGQPYEILGRLRRADGTYRWTQNRGFPLRARTSEIVRWCVLLTDVDDEKRAEQALRESEHEARRVVDTIPGLVVTLTQAGEVEFVNSRTLEYLGLGMPAAKDWATNGIVHLEDIPRVGPIFERGVATGVPFDYEVRLRRVDGKHLWFQLRAHPFRGSGGTVNRWYVLLTDIDGLKRAEEAQQQSERELRLIVDTVPGLVVILAGSGEVHFENRRTREYIGPRLSETGEWASNGIAHPDDIPRILPIFNQGISSGVPFEYEVRVRHASGVYRWFQLRGHPLHDASGDVARWYLLLSDIDDRRRTEEELRRSKLFLTEGQRISLTGTFSWQIETDEITFSEELKRIFEFDQHSTVTPDRIRARIFPFDLSGLEEWLARAGRDNAEYETRLEIPGTGIKHVCVYARLIRNADGRPEIIGAVQDVTRRRLAEEARDAARTELAHVARVMSLSSLTASIAHEITQPLTGVVTNSSTCLRMLGADPPDVNGARETVQRTLRDANRASDIITRLHGLFSKRQFTPEVLDVNDVVREVIELSLDDLQRRHVVVQSELGEDLPSVSGDRVQLQQVLLNFLRNASDAMASVADDARRVVIQTARDGDGGVRVAVCDSGQGVELQDMQKLFEPFYTTKEGGTGIGLSLSRSIIERHRGRIWAEDNEGTGATFSFCVPPHQDALGVSDSSVEGFS